MRADTRWLRACATLGVVGLAGCSMWSGSAPKTGYGGAGNAGASATLEPRSGSEVRGVVTFFDGMHHTMVRVDVAGLRPNAEHGFHVHEKGDCSAPDASSAAGHFNPGGAAHGNPATAERHAGDLPNLKSDAAGNARVTIPVRGLTVASGERSVVGRSLVIHRDPDDYRSQPAGNSGPRIACGLIVAR